MDYGGAVGMEIREVREVEREGNPARAIEGSRVYSTGIEELWDAITSAERIARWFLPIRGELKVGGRYQLEGNAEGTITRCDPPQALEVTWEYGGGVSWVSVRLAQENDGARLSLVHTMPKDEVGEAYWETYGPGAAGVGSDLSFRDLELHLASGGGAIDRAAADAWLASDEGKAFLKSCADSWARAHAAAGEDPEVAQAMAERTASFYAGE